MSPESNPLEQKKFPTPQDLQNLEVAVSGLGRGDLVHEIAYHMGILRRVFKKATEEGWANYLLTSWNEGAAEVSKLIARVRQDRAKEKGLD